MSFVNLVFSLASARPAAMWKGVAPSDNTMLGSAPLSNNSWDSLKQIDDRFKKGKFLNKSSSY